MERELKTDYDVQTHGEVRKMQGEIETIRRDPEAAYNKIEKYQLLTVLASFLGVCAAIGGVIS